MNSSSYLAHESLRARHGQVAERHLFPRPLRPDDDKRSSDPSRRASVCAPGRAVRSRVYPAQIRDDVARVGERSSGFLPVFFDPSSSNAKSGAALISHQLRSHIDPIYQRKPAATQTPSEAKTDLLSGEVRRECCCIERLCTGIVGPVDVYLIARGIAAALGVGVRGREYDVRAVRIRADLYDRAIRGNLRRRHCE